MATANMTEGEGIELNDLGKDNEAADQSDQGSKDTNVDDDLLSGDPNESIPIMSSGSNPDHYSEVSGDIFMDSLLWSPDDSIRDDMVGVSVWRLNMLRDLKVKEKILDKVYGVKFRGRYGEKTRSLLKSLRVKRAPKTGNETGLEFTDPDEVRSGERKYKDVITGYSVGKLRQSTGGGVTDAYKRLVEEAKKEYNDNSLRAETERVERRSATTSATKSATKTATKSATKTATTSTPKAKTTTTDKNESVNEGASTSTATNTTTTTNKVGSENVDQGQGTTDNPVTDDVMDEVSDIIAGRLDDTIRGESDDIETRARDLKIPPNEVREIRGLLELGMRFADQMTSLDINIEYFEKRSIESDDLDKKLFYKSVARVARLTKDYIRIRNGLKPLSNEALGILEEVVDGSDQLRLERFKKWVKKNAVGISGVAITVGGIITGIVMGARSALTVGARGLGKFAGAVARVFKKLGPLFSALGTVISTALSLGAKGILWLASNLWILAIALAVVVYNKYTTK